MIHSVNLKGLMIDNPINNNKRYKNEVVQNNVDIPNKRPILKSSCFGFEILVSKHKKYKIQTIDVLTNNEELNPYNPMNNE
jgi:hypothetical protein